MVGKGSSGVESFAPAANRAEIDALESVVATSLAMAEKLNSEAASALLERALALLRSFGCDGEADVEGTAAPFIPS